MKEPLIPNGVLAATTDEATIRKWWGLHPRANIGLDCGGANFMVLDFDPGSSKEACAKAIGGLPETGLRSRTPRGGDHWFYALSPGEMAPPYTASNVKGGPKFSPHVDVRSFHSYVLLPPSRTKDGVYEWVSEQKPHHRTNEMYRIAHTARQKSKDRDDWIIEADLPDNIALAINWLKSDAKPAIKGSGGNITAYATAAMCKSYGLSPATAFETMWDHWGPRCSPAWYSPESLETVIEHAYSYNTSPPGNMTPAYKVAKAAELFKPKLTELAQGGREIQGGRFRFVDRDGMANIRPPSWLVKDFLPVEAYAMLVGAPGTFKSFIALDIALSIAAPWSDSRLWDATECGPVLYIAGEGRSGMANRVTAWERQHNHGYRAGNFVLADPVPNVNEDWQGFIDGAAQLLPPNEGYRLVVLDTVGRAMQGANENSQEHASKLTAKAEQLIREFGCTVLALHHSGHGDQSRGKGSMEFIGAPDTIATLEREEGLSAALRVVKQKDGEEWSKPRLVKLKEIILSSEPLLKTLVPVSTEEGQSVRAKEAIVSRNYETQFLVALSQAPRDKDGTCLWSDVRASMVGMNDDQAQNAPKFLKELQNWFTRWPRRREFDTGRRGASNAVILRLPH